MRSGVRVRKGMVKVPDQIDEDDIIDRRSEDLRQFAVEDTVSIDALKDVFAGTDLVGDKEKVRFVLELRGEVRRHWGAARDCFSPLDVRLWRPSGVFRSWNTNAYGRVWIGCFRLVTPWLRNFARSLEPLTIKEFPKTPAPVVMRRPIRLLYSSRTSFRWPWTVASSARTLRARR